VKSRGEVEKYNKKRTEVGKIRRYEDKKKGKSKRTEWKIGLG
jgi:hypothetical protein